jgi:alanine racemase
MKPNGSNSCWVEVDLGAIEKNVRSFVEQTGVQVMAVVKANGYGHGAVKTARAALRGGAKWLGVARVEEALELRDAGIDEAILVLGFTPLERTIEAIEYDISLTIWNSQQLNIISKQAMKMGKSGRVHLKIDTGMNRLGVKPDDALDMALAIDTDRFVVFEGVFTHFARADESDPAPTDAQENRFRQVLDHMRTAGIHPKLIHASNSAAGLSRPTSYFNLIRVGISMYGLHPSFDCQLPIGFRAALTWKTVLSQIKMLPPGQGVSYGHTYQTRGTERIGTLPVGYADGFRRCEGNIVLAGGKRVPVVGRVCMDQMMVNLDKVPEAAPGDEIVLIGKQGKDAITAEEVAEIWGTINYEVVCDIAARVPRIYRID